MSHVYAVTEGEYEEFRILACFTTLEKAEAWIEKFTSKQDNMTIEPYTLDPDTGDIADITRPGWYATIDFRKGKIISSGEERSYDFRRRGWVKIHDHGDAPMVATSHSTISQAHADKLATDLWAQVMLDNPDIEERWEKVGR